MKITLGVAVKVSKGVSEMSALRDVSFVFVRFSNLQQLALWFRILIVPLL